jgi:myosin heavy subunit
VSKNQSNGLADDGKLNEGIKILDKWIEKVPLALDSQQIVNVLVKTERPANVAHLAKWFDAIKHIVIKTGQPRCGTSASRGITDQRDIVLEWLQNMHMNTAQLIQSTNNANAALGNTNQTANVVVAGLRKSQTQMGTELKTKTTELERANTNLAELQTTVEQTKQVLATKERDLTQTKQVLATKERDLTQIKHDLDTKEKELTLRNQALAGATTELEKANAVLEQYDKYLNTGGNDTSKKRARTAVVGRMQRTQNIIANTGDGSGDSSAPSNPSVTARENVHQPLQVVPNTMDDEEGSNYEPSDQSTVSMGTVASDSTHPIEDDLQDYDELPTPPTTP